MKPDLQKRPHVVVIMADQLRYDILGTEHTPHINKLAEESVVFNRAYCASPLCVPARGAFFSGKYPNVTGCLINPWEQADAEHGYVRTAADSLYSLMENEWDSWNVGKQHFLTKELMHQSPDSKTHWKAGNKDYTKFVKENGKRIPGGTRFKALAPEMAMGRITRAKAYSIPSVGCYEEGFDYFYDGYIVNAALNAIRSRDHNKPLLLNTMFLAPHPPLDIPEPWYSNIGKMNLPENVGTWYTDQSPLQLYNISGALGTRYRREDWEEIWPVYMGLVTLLDDCVGMIVKELKEQGMYDESLILFTSDHGEMLGSHGLWQKMCMYEEAVRTPLYFKMPESKAINITQIDEPVSAVDILPTLCDLLEIESPLGLNGVSLMPLTVGNPIARESIYIQSDGNGARGNFQRCIIRGGDKLIVDLFKDEIFFELYHVETDPQETKNLAFDGQNASQIMSMLEELIAHMKETSDLIEIPEDAYERFIEDYSRFHSSEQGGKKNVQV